MADEDKELFTKIPNNVLEELAKAKLNGTQYAICLVIFRSTFGFHRCKHEISATYISNATNIALRQIKRELQILTDRNIIIKTNLKKGVTSTIGINKEMDSWKPVTKKTLVTNPSPVVVTKKTPVLVTNPSPKKEKKENIKEIYIVSLQKIFDLWNENKIIVHQKITDDIEKAVIKALKQNTEEEIKTSILHYSKMIHDVNYSLCNYKWSLATFLSREKGYRLFLDGGEKWVNYLDRDKPKPQPKPKLPAETSSTAAVINGGYIDFYDG